MKKLYITILFLLIIFVTGCSSTEEKLTGLWKYNDTYIKFNGDGTIYYTYFVDSSKKEITFVSDEGYLLDGSIYKFELKKDKLIINDDTIFERVDSSDDFDNYLKVSSNAINYQDEIEYSELETYLEDTGYLNYINEYYKIINIPTKNTNFISEDDTINLVCQIVNKYNSGIQMNENNCIIST